MTCGGEAIAPYNQVLTSTLSSYIPMPSACHLNPCCLSRGCRKHVGTADATALSHMGLKGLSLCYCTKTHYTSRSNPARCCVSLSTPAGDPTSRGGSHHGSSSSSSSTEEADITGALRRSFQRVDDIILAISRSDGVRDGATALVLMRLGNALYAAHAGVGSIMTPGDHHALCCQCSDCSVLLFVSFECNTALPHT